MDFKSNFQDITLDTDFFKRCNTFISLLQQWGKVHNLTGRLTKEDIEENIIDSVYPLKFIDSFDSFADIGTGAGYPGFIIAMARSDVKTYLIEPRLKRVAFLNFVKNTLGLNNIEIIGKRVEDVENLKVDLITSRAVSNTKLLLDITKNISKESSSFLFYKGTLLEEEIKDAKIENCEVFSRKDRNYLYLKGLK
jgi:16S rRNA (guanine527-N7)-methyltransferase